MSRPGFRLLWGGQFVSDFGGQLSVVALPCAVVLLLGATTFQTALVGAVETGIVPLLALVAGVVVDRVRRRPLMIGANVVRLLAFLSIPVAAAAHVLSLAQVIAVAAIAGGASVFFDTAYQAFLPVLVGRDHLVDGNQKMQFGASAAEVAGNSAAGALVAAAGAPFAVLLNAGAYAIGTLALLRIRCDEPRVQPSGGSLRADLVAGWRFVLGDPVLRSLGFANAVAHLGGGMVSAVFFVYVLRESHLSPLAAGIMLALGNAGIIGALLAGRIVRALGVRTTLAAALALAAAGQLLLPVCAHTAPFAALVIMRLAATFAGPLFDITQQTVRVERTPEHLHGRMNAAMRTIVWGALPLGAIAGGATAAHLGALGAIAAGGLVTLSSLPLVLRRPAAAFRSTGDGVLNRLEPAVVGQSRGTRREAADQIAFRPQLQPVAGT